MAYRLIWSPLSRDDLHDIVRFISIDSQQRAQVFAFRLMAQADMLQDQPEIGRMVPEHHLPNIREIIFRPYRVVYRVNHTQQLIEIARVWHAARGMPELPAI